MTDIVVKLTKPINAHEIMVSELTLREPTGQDIVKSGFPYAMEIRGSGRKFTFDTAAIRELIIRCAAITGPAVDELSARDFQTVQGALLNFFADLNPES